MNNIDKTIFLGRKRKVLLVHGAIANREKTRTALEDSWLSVETTDRADEAVERVQKGEFHAVLTTPEARGFTATKMVRLMRQAGVQIPIVLLAERTGTVNPVGFSAVMKDPLSDENVAVLKNLMK